MHQNTPSDELTTPVHMHMAGSTARPGRPFTPEPAGRTGLREARAAPADTPAELLGSLPAPASIVILTRTTHTAKHVGWQAAQPERQQVNRMRSKHKITTFVPDILLLEHWNRRFESFPTMYRSGGCLWLAGSEYRV